MTYKVMVQWYSVAQGGRQPLADRVARGARGQARSASERQARARARAGVDVFAG